MSLTERAEIAPPSQTVAKRHELLIQCRRCDRAFWTGLIIAPELFAEAGLPGDTFSCPDGHVEEYTSTDMFHDRRSGDAGREDQYLRGSIDRRHRERRAGEL